MFELFQPTHLLFVFLVALVLFGPKRLVEMSRGISPAIQSLQRVKEDIKDELTNLSTEDEPVKGHTIKKG